MISLSGRVRLGGAYLGDLIGYSPVRDVARRSAVHAPKCPHHWLSAPQAPPRRSEQRRDVTGWPARVVVFNNLAPQYMNPRAS
jgi:hypothetical protein